MSTTASSVAELVDAMSALEQSIGEVFTPIIEGMARVTDEAFGGQRWEMSSDDESPTVFWNPLERPKYSCPYCHGVTYDDERGNCSACGGPRGEDDGSY